METWQTVIMSIVGSVGAGSILAASGVGWKLYNAVARLTFVCERIVEDQKEQKGHIETLYESRNEAKSRIERLEYKCGTGKVNSNGERR